MIRKFLLNTLLLGTLIVGLTMSITSCSSDDDLIEEGQGKQPAAKTGATMQMTVMFAPGQLGDKGYADGVMEGIISIEDFSRNYYSDTLDVRFMTTLDLEDAKSSIVKWAQNDKNPFYDCTYERRLLVLTEPFMAGLIPLIRDYLRPTDEVLFLKLNEDDIAQMAKQFSLGSRIHGLNIPATEPARNFGKYILRMMNNPEASPGALPQVPFYQIPVLRLYDSKKYPYRDGLVEAIQQELGNGFELVEIDYSDSDDAGLNSIYASESIVESAFQAAHIVEVYNYLSGIPIAIVDFGAGNAGWDYYLMGQAYSASNITTLMLDAKDAPRLSRYYIDRHFGDALFDWVLDWLLLPVGAMAAQITYDDEYYYDTNIFAPDDLED